MIGNVGRGGEVGPTTLEDRVNDLRTTLNQCVTKDKAEEIYAKKGALKTYTEAIFGCETLPENYKYSKDNSLVGELPCDWTSAYGFVWDVKAVCGYLAGYWIGVYGACLFMSVGSLTLFVWGVNRRAERFETTGCANSFFSLSACAQLIVDGVVSFKRKIGLFNRDKHVLNLNNNEFENNKSKLNIENNN